MNVMRSNIDVLLSNITNAKIDVDELIRNLVCVRHTFRHGKARLGSAWLGLGEVGAAWGGSARFEAIVRVAQVFESSYSATLIKFKNDTAKLDVLPSNIVDVSHHDIHESSICVPAIPWHRGLLRKQSWCSRSCPQKVPLRLWRFPLAGLLR